MAPAPGEDAIERAFSLGLISLSLATCDRALLDRALNRCEADPKIEGREVTETILQSIPYSGFPGAVEALGVWRSRRPGDPAGVPASAPSPSSSTSASSPGDTGEQIFRVIYRDAADAVRAELRRRHPELEVWILEFAYGRVMGRGVLELKDLEALAVASLLGQRRRTPLHSHLRGALRAGWSRKDLATLMLEGR